MKDTTKKSSNHLRAIAGLVKALGIILAVLLGLIGAATISSGSSSTLGIEGAGLIVIALLILFWHFVIYVMISAYATIVENSDRSDVVDAILQVVDTLYEMKHND